MNSFFNAQHSPAGAFASFTLGYPGRAGGLGLELGKPADQNVYIGLQSSSSPATYKMLPFYEEINSDASRFDIESVSNNTEFSVTLEPYRKSEIRRELDIATDTWYAGDMTFRIYSPVVALPDPSTAPEEDITLVTVPAVLVEITVDNTACSERREVLFGYEGNDPYSAMRCFDTGVDSRVAGVGQGLITAIATDEPDVRAGLSFVPQSLLEPLHSENLRFGLGKVGALLFSVPGGSKKCFRCAVCFYRGGCATAGQKTRYWYTRYFGSIEEVAEYVLTNFETIKNRILHSQSSFDTTGLSREQRVMLSHAIHSYYGSTQLLERENEPLWIVNEGEYRMMNTLDLTADQLFFEMKMNPWTVKNVLSEYLRRYSYEDAVVFPGESNEYSGGTGFTHDMGVGNVFSLPGRSVYELSGLHGCFSYMTHEQLVNWVCCASVYLHQSTDSEWLDENRDVFRKMLESMCNRDHPDDSQRDGIMDLESSRTRGGAEITTYDSLDTSLGQARRNTYLAVKCWAAYCALEKIFYRLDDRTNAEIAAGAAHRCASTIVQFCEADGTIPAVIDGKNRSRIIPIIEGLVFPLYTGCKEVLDPEGIYGEFIRALTRHVEKVLGDRRCLFDDGGWKLSTTSDNSWLSKIYLCQFVARHLLKIDVDPQADTAHLKWLTDRRNAYWAWSDQMVAGSARGSRYYPRGVTAVLWLDECVRECPVYI
jgi:hypothetical protein